MGAPIASSKGVWVVGADEGIDRFVGECQIAQAEAAAKIATRATINVTMRLRTVLFPN